MKIFFLILLILVVAVTVALWFWRQSDHTADRAVITGLATLQPAAPERFDLALLEGLPEPAQRYFRYTIQPGTPLYTVARISMNGKFGMGNRESPDYVHMQATQVLAMPEGFIWKMSAHRGLLGISGSDTDQWTRFWLMGLFPVARLVVMRIMPVRHSAVMWQRRFSGRRPPCCRGPAFPGSWSI